MVEENDENRDAIHRIAEKKMEEILNRGEHDLKLDVEKILSHLANERIELPYEVQQFLLLKRIEGYVGELRQGAVSRIFNSGQSKEVRDATIEAIRIIARGQLEGLEGDKFEEMARFLEWDVLDGAIPRYSQNFHDKKKHLLEEGGTDLSRTVRDIAQELRNNRNPLAKDGELLDGNPRTPAAPAIQNGKSVQKTIR
ncbi:MAG: hypothetical protein ABII22_06235 [Candidatus Micrarchaeota archaeon]